MDLQIRGHDITITDEIRSYVDRRSQKLDQLLDRVVDAQLELRTSHHRSGGDITSAQLTIHTRRSILRAEERDHDPLKAVDQAVDKMMRRIRRYHDKRTDRKGPRIDMAPPAPGTAELDALADATDDEFDDTGEAIPGTLVRTKRFSAKPMDPEEAIDQMDLLGHDFFLFFNASENEMNVVYRRRDGAYGLLAPERR